MRVDDKMIDRIASTVEGFEELLKRRQRDDQEAEQDRQVIQSLRKELSDLKSKMASTEYQAAEQQVKNIAQKRAQLETEQAAFEADKKVEYNKGYAAAYVEVTKSMGSSN